LNRGAKRRYRQIIEEENGKKKERKKRRETMKGERNKGTIYVLGHMFDCFNAIIQLKT
jgi:hypothetical protein